MHRLFRKLGFILRFLWAKMYYYPNLKMEGFVFLEPRVVFTIAKNAKIVLKNRVYIKTGAIIECSGNGYMELNERVCVCQYAFVGCTNKLIAHHDSFIGQGATVMDANHTYDEEETMIDDVYDDGVTIIGAYAQCYPKCNIGPNVTLAARTLIMPLGVVTKSITEERTVWGGIPATWKRNRARGAASRD